MHELKTIQKLPITLEQAWDFFSSPENLQSITPEYLSFKILSPLPKKMYPGTIISYTVRPVAGIPLNWVTEISHIDEPHFFVDEQRFGPYSFWHHKHFFRAIPGGVAMEDHVHYKLPFGIFGRIVHSLFVKKQLNAIFTYRFAKLESLFGKME